MNRAEERESRGGVDEAARESSGKGLANRLKRYGLNEVERREVSEFPRVKRTGEPLVVVGE